MAAFVSWLQGHGYSVRLLIGDIHYDTWVIEEIVHVLKSRNIPRDAPLLIVEPTSTDYAAAATVIAAHRHRPMVLRN